MRTSFRTLFTLAVAHSFYGVRCRDFRFSFPEDTERALRNGKLLAKERDGVLYVLYEVGDDDEPLVPITGATLRIGLHLLNPYFANFTAVPAGFPSNKLLYRNLAATDALDAVETIPLVGPVFAHELSTADRPVAVTAADGAGAQLGRETVAAGDERTSVSFDLRGLPPGKIRVTESFSAGPSETSYYLDGELSRQNAAGVVEITIDAGFYDSSPNFVPPDFEVAFEAREETLSYYVVARNYSNGDVNQLSVSDVGFSEDDRDEVEFDKITPQNFTAAELSPSLLAESGAKVVLFRSENPLARREKARRRMQLSKNGDVLIANLPQPGADRAKAELIIHLSKP